MSRENVEFCIYELTEETFSFNYDANFLKLDKNELCFQFEQISQVTEEDDKITIIMRIHIMSQHKELAAQGVRASFIVKPFKAAITKIEEKGFEVINQSIIDTFVSICIGAARGMFVKNLKGTPLDGVIIPLVPMPVITKNSTRKRISK